MDLLSTFDFDHWTRHPILTEKTYYYTDYEDNREPAYVYGLLQPVSLSLALPGPGKQGRELLAQAVEIAASNVGGRFSTASTFLSHPLLGEGYGTARIKIPGGATLLALSGPITSVGPRNRHECRMRLASTNEGSFDTLLPRLTTRSVFPNADTSTVSGLDHPVIIPFGVMRFAELALVVDANVLDCTFGITWSSGDGYTYADLTHVADLAISSGYHLEYTVWWSTSDATIAMDLECSDGTRLKDQSVNDQNGFAAHPATDISSKCTAAFYRRRISLASLVGKNVTKFLVGSERNANGSFYGKIQQAVIVDANGTVVREIVTRNVTSISSVLAYPSNANNSATIGKDNNYYYGAVRALGSTTLQAVYRNGGVVPAAEYTAWIDFINLLLVSFPVRQVDASGNPLAIHADITVGQFASNFANVIGFLLSDTLDGMGWAVDSTQQAATASFLSGKGITCGGGLDRQRSLAELLDDLLVYGGYLSRMVGSKYAAAAGKYLIYADDPASYTTATLAWEDGTEKRWNNCVVLDDGNGELRNKIGSVTLRGGLQRDLGGTESWGLRTTHYADEVEDSTTDLTLDYPYVIDAMVLDKLAYYQMERYQQSGRPLHVELTRRDDYALAALNVQAAFSCVDLDYNEDDVRCMGVAIRDYRIYADLEVVRVDLHTYTPGTEIVIEPRYTLGTDYSRTLPGAPTAVGEVSVVLTQTADLTRALAYTITATAPAVNVQELAFRLYRYAGGVVNTLYGEWRVLTAPGAAQQVALALPPGLDFAVRVYSRVPTNAVGFQESTAYGELIIRVPGYGVALSTASTLGG